MITIEDLLEELSNISMLLQAYAKDTSYIIASPADRKFLQDLCERTRAGGKFSTKQADIARKIIVKYASLFNDVNLRKISHLPKLNLSADEIINICEYPSYRQIPYQSTDVPREVRYLGKNKLGFKSKYSPQIIDKIKSLKSEVNFSTSIWPRFDKETKLWVVNVDEHNIDRVISIINKFKFQFDEDVVQFLTDCKNSIGATSTAVSDDSSIFVVIQNNPFLTKWFEEILLVEEELNV